jgi:predicted TIM-barrel fold metal-dependent hydrolase
MTAPNYPVPPGACDAHVHAFGPTSLYPGAPGRQYQPSDLPLDAYLALARRLGLSRRVFVQPSAYGSDNRCQLDALARCGGSARAVVVLGDDVPDRLLPAMHAQGVRGVRANLMNPRVADPAAARRLLEPLAARIAGLGWHLQIYADLDVIAPIAPVLATLPVPVVLDHAAGVRSPLPVDDPRFAAVLGLLASGGGWVKLSGADIVASFAGDFAPDAAPYLRALIAAGPARLVWGSDWPHLVHFHGASGDAAPPAGHRDVDESALLDLLRDCVPDEATWRRILVDNPAQLYGF